MTNKNFRVGIVGATGFGGAELLRILCDHPDISVVYATAGEAADQPIESVHPNLRGLYDLTFSPHPRSESDFPDKLEGLFLGVPHGKSMGLLPMVPRGLKVVDLAADYRLDSPELFFKYYGIEHRDSKRLSQAVYGLTEINRKQLKGADFVANPGCFATAVQLGLYPLLKNSLVCGQIFCDAKTGSSGSGASPRKSTHHPVREGSFYAYKLLSHQHEGEIMQTIERCGFKGSFNMQVHSAPFARGIFASIYCSLELGVSGADIANAYKEVYQNSRFIRLVEGSPDIHWVRQSNYADIGYVVKGDSIVCFVAIDNLVKGAAGQAIQNMNLMLSLREESGLLSPGGFPS